MNFVNFQGPLSIVASGIHLFVLHKLIKHSDLWKVESVLKSRPLNRYVKLIRESISSDVLGFPLRDCPTSVSDRGHSVYCLYDTLHICVRILTGSDSQGDGNQLHLSTCYNVSVERYRIFADCDCDSD